MPFWAYVALAPWVLGIIIFALFVLDEIDAWRIRRLERRVAELQAEKARLLEQRRLRPMPRRRGERGYQRRDR